MTTANADPSGTANQANEAVSNELDALGCRLIWDVTAIGSYLLRIADLLGRQIGVSGSQWITLKAVETLDHGEGVSIKDVAALLNIDRSFLSVQSKALEARGLIRRNNAKASDRRLVLLSLTDLAVAHMNGVQPSKHAIEEHVRGELDGQALVEIANVLLMMRRRLGRAVLLVAASG